MRNAMYILIITLLILPLNSNSNSTLLSKTNATKTKVNRNDGYFPKNGFVPDSDTAIKIAEAVWLPIYGKMIYEEKPFKAKLINKEYWEVTGTLPKGYDGGTVVAHIRKLDGKILYVIHEK